MQFKPWFLFYDVLECNIGNVVCNILSLMSGPWAHQIAANHHVMLQCIYMAIYIGTKPGIGNWIEAREYFVLTTY